QPLHATLAILVIILSLLLPTPKSTLFPYTTLFRSRLPLTHRADQQRREAGRHGRAEGVPTALPAKRTLAAGPRVSDGDQACCRACHPNGRVRGGTATRSRATRPRHADRRATEVGGRRHRVDVLPRPVYARCGRRRRRRDADHVHAIAEPPPVLVVVEVGRHIAGRRHQNGALAVGVV